MHFRYRYTISYPKFWKPKSSENRKFFHGVRLQPKYDGHHDNDDDIDVTLFSRMFYLQTKSTLVVLWSIFIPLKIKSAKNNIYQLVPISFAILSLSSWPLIPLITIPKSEKFRFPKRVWFQGFRIRDCVPVVYLSVHNFFYCNILHLAFLLTHR
jgi:hypothetical protein